MKDLSRVWPLAVCLQDYSSDAFQQSAASALELSRILESKGDLAVTSRRLEDLTSPLARTLSKAMARSS